MRLFVAAEIDDAVKDRLIGIQSRLIEPGVKLTERENLHFTLKFLGDVPDADVGDIREALRKITFQPFELNIGNIGSFPPGGERIDVVWVGCSGPLSQLAGLIESVLRPLGFEEDARGFSAHLTLARIKQKSSFLADRISTIKNVQIGTQKVGRFILKRSILTPHGPIYQNVEIYELGK